MSDEDQVNRDFDESSAPTHVEGARRAEEMVQHEGDAADHIDLDETGAGRPAAGRTAHDPMRAGQDKQGMKERGTVDPDAPDPSGGPV